MCSNGFKLVFQNNTCKIRKGSRDMVVAGRITHGNIYQLKGVANQCLISQVNESWLWHQRMGHVNFDNLVKLSSKEIAREIPRITRLSNVICRSCQLGKKTRSSFKGK